MLDRDMRLVQLTGGRYHARAALLRRGARGRCDGEGCRPAGHRRRGDRHLSLNENDVGAYRTFFKMSPPLRSEDDRQALVAALADGTIDVVCSAHDPQDVEGKRQPFAEAADGAVGLETMLAVGLRLVHSGDVTLLRLVEAMSTRPAALLRPRGGHAGAGRAGRPCDRRSRPAVDRARGRAALTLASNTAFEGARLTGMVLRTMVGGNTVLSRCDAMSAAGCSCSRRPDRRLSARLDSVRADPDADRRARRHPRDRLRQYRRHQRAAHRPQGPRRRDASSRRAEGHGGRLSAAPLWDATRRCSRALGAFLGHCFPRLAPVQGRQGRRDLSRRSCSAWTGR